MSGNSVTTNTQIKLQSETQSERLLTANEKKYARGFVTLAEIDRLAEEADEHIRLQTAVDVTYGVANHKKHEETSVRKQSSS